MADGTDAVSAVLTKYINPMKGWQPRHVELNTSSGLFTTCHTDSLGIPERATTTIVDIRGATVQLETAEPTFTVACVDGTKVSLRCENGQERTFWVSMLSGVGVQQGAPPGDGGGGGGGGGGGLMSLGGGFLARSKAAAAKAAEAAQQVGGAELIDNAYKMSQKAAAGAAAVAKAASYTTHDIGGMQIQIGAQLAEGGYSFVHFAEEAGTGRQFALKRIVMMGGEANKNAKWELDVLRKLQGHKNIMKLFAHGTMRLKRDGCTEMLFVCELCDGGHLYDFYQKMGGKIPEEKLIDVFSQCCEGVGYLHSQQPALAHRDIKIENFLLQGDTVKLCDFGSCTAGAKVYESRKDILDEEEIIQKYSTMMYRAPEMVDLYSGQLVCELVDVWALGCVLFTLAYGKHPFGDAGTLHILSGKYTIPEARKYSDRIPSIVAFMLIKTVAERPTAVQSLDYIRTGKGGSRAGGSGGSGPMGALAGSGGAVPPRGAAAAQRHRKVAADDDFDPRHASPVPATRAAAAPAPAAAPGGGGNALFGMLDWQDDGQAPAPAPAPAGAAAFDPGALSGEEDEAFEANFDESFAPAPAPAPARPTGGGSSGGGGGNALFGMLDWQDGGGSPAPAPAPAPAAAPLQLSGGGEFKPSFDDAFGDASATSPVVAAAAPAAADDFFGSDPFAAAPAAAFTPAAAAVAPAGSAKAASPPAAVVDDFFGGDPFAATPTTSSSSPAPAPQPAGVSPSADDFFGVSTSPAPAPAMMPMSQQPGGGASPQPMATMMPMAAMVPTTSASSTGSPAPRTGAQPVQKTGGSAFDSLSWS